MTQVDAVVDAAYGVHTTCKDQDLKRMAKRKEKMAANPSLQFSPANSPANRQT
jgi:hypothetical protein